MKTTGTGVALLASLDHGAYREAIARYESSQSTDDPIETIWRAEVALYLDRLDDARAELERLSGGLDRELANRVQTIRAEIAFWDKALDDARDLIGPIIQSTWEAGDHQGHLRATLLPARIELRRGNSAEALEKLKEPRRLATVLGNDFYAGFIAHCRAYAYFNLGDLKQAGHAFAEALHLLGKSEQLRWEASCRILYAGFLADLGRFEDSIAECEKVESVAFELGIVGDALWARSTMARTLMSLGRFEEVVDRLKDVLSWERVTRHVYGELMALQLLAIAQCELNRFDDAERAAEEARQLARLVNDSQELDCLLLRLWAGARAGHSGAVAELIQIVKTCDRTGNDFNRAEVRLYLADALSSSQPDVASRLCLEAQAFGPTEENRRLRNLFERVQKVLSSGSVRIGPRGEIIVDPSCGWPDFDSTVETVKRFLILEAVHRSGGNRSDAARKLGLTRSRLHDLWHQLHGRPSRPRRVEADATALRDEELGQEHVGSVDHELDAR